MDTQYEIDSNGRHGSTEICVKESMHLYAYPVTYFLSEVTDYPHIVGNSQIFDRTQYLWGFRVTKLRFGISVNGDFEIIMK